LCGMGTTNMFKTGSNQKHHLEQGGCSWVDGTTTPRNQGCIGDIKGGNTKRRNGREKHRGVALVIVDTEKSIIHQRPVFLQERDPRKKESQRQTRGGRHFRRKKKKKKNEL